MLTHRSLGPLCSFLLFASACGDAATSAPAAKRPLQLGEASAALCGGGANRKGDGTGPNGNGPDQQGSGGSSGTTTTGSGWGGNGRGGSMVN